MLKRTLLLWVIVGLVVAFGAVFQVGTLLAKPNRNDVGPAPSYIPLEKVEFQSRSGYLVRGWFVPGLKGGGGIVLIHGMRADRRSMLGRAKFLHSHGYSVLLVDLQAHGESEGEWITFGFLESQDVRSAVEFVKDRLPDEKIGVIGVSMGGVACVVGPEPLNVDALVLEAVYPDVIQAIRNRLEIRFGPFGQWLEPILTLQIKLRLGIDPKQLRPADRISDVLAPTLIVAGENDRRTRISESKLLHSLAPEPKEFWVVPDASHNDFHRHAKSAYESRVLEFLQKHMQKADSQILHPTKINPIF